MQRLRESLLSTANRIHIAESPIGGEKNVNQTSSPVSTNKSDQDWDSSQYQSIFANSLTNGKNRNTTRDALQTSSPTATILSLSK